jgi:cell division septation protein DedD
MASGGKRGAGDRVLESKHVIGLFLLMLLFSGVFFTLGYVMGRNQYDVQVRAASTGVGKPEPTLMAKPDPAPKKTVEQPSTADESDRSISTSDSEWKYATTNQPAKSEPRLEPAPKAPAPSPASKPLNVKGKVSPQPVSEPVVVKSAKTTTAGAPLIPKGAIVLQVAALLKQDDALSIASGLQKKHYAAYVQTPIKDKYYRVQVGPFKDQKSADAAKKGLEGEGFKAFYVKH